MSAADIQIAKLLYEARVHLADRHDTRALDRAPEALKPELLRIWLDELEWDVEVVISAAHMRDELAAGRTHQQVYDAALYEQFERAVWDDVDTELWIIQSEDEREALAYSRAHWQRPAILMEQAS